MHTPTVPEFNGRCYCGAAMFNSIGPATPILHCHCGECRRLSGAAFSTWVSLPRAGFTVSGEASLATFAPTANTLRHFCQVCGTHLFSEDRRFPAVHGVPAGVLDHLPASGPQGHIFVGDMAAWHTLGDDMLPKLGGLSGTEPLRKRRRPAPIVGKETVSLGEEVAEHAC